MYNDDTIILKEETINVRQGRLNVVKFYVTDEMRPNTIGAFGHMLPVYKEHGKYFLLLNGKPVYNGSLLTATGKGLDVVQDG